MYIAEIEVMNFRCFSRVCLRLRHPAEVVTDLPGLECRNVTILLGDNGSGKSSILRALALAVVGPIIRDSGYRPYFLVNRASKRNKAIVDATAILHRQDVEAATKSSTGIVGKSRLHAEVLRRGDYESVISSMPRGPSWSNIFQENSPAFFVAGYGATRRVDDPSEFSLRDNLKTRSTRYQRVASLFEPQVPLMSLSSWLPQLMIKSKGRFSQVRTMFEELLPKDIRFTGKIIDRDYAFRFRGSDIPFSALSDGYRAYLGWISDLLYHVVTTCPTGMKLKDNCGLVLVDEIDLYLHPIWQRSVIETVSNALPKLQFVFTTHSPIVAASLHRENIYVTEFSEKGEATARQFDERIYGLSSDQALESSYFGVPSTRPEGFLKEVRDMLSKANTKVPSAAIDIMDRLSGGKNGALRVSNRRANQTTRVLG